MKKRYYTLDYIRGFAIFNMILFHTFWDLVYIFNYDLPWFNTSIAYIWQQCICWTFILLSGFCYSLSSNKLKRGLIIFACGLLISIITELLIPDNHILFGVLTLIGSAMILIIPFYKYIDKINPILGFFVSMILFLISRNVNNGYLGFESFDIYELPTFLYRNLFTSYLGFPNAGFYSSDYFSIIPWIFLFICGIFAFKLFKSNNKLYLLEKRYNLFVEFCGQKSLLIYLLHQPIIFIILLFVAS